MIKDPRITVATIVQNEGRFLMVEEVCDGEVVFNQPAGHVEANESFIQAAERETLEETGWKVAVSHFLGVYVLPMPKNGFTYYRFCYIAEPFERTDLELDRDIVAAHWLSLKDISALNGQLRSPLVLQCVKDYEKGVRLPLDTVKEFASLEA